MLWFQEPFSADVCKGIFCPLNLCSALKLENLLTSEKQDILTEGLYWPSVAELNGL